jgi:prevent-host-death family protein
MSQFNIAEAKSHLSELVQKALLGEEVVIAKDNKPVIRLVPVVAQTGARTPGSAKGLITYMAEDFDTTPEDFQGYS